MSLDGTSRSPSAVDALNRDCQDVDEDDQDDAKSDEVDEVLLMEFCATMFVMNSLRFCVHRSLLMTLLCLNLLML